GVTNTYLYDGWAMIRETSPTVTNSYIYGLDLSGSPQGAGTIGGILSALLNGTHIFYCYDANGNVTDLVDTNGSSVAHYEYGPFGQKTTEPGTLSASNPFQFSSKYLDAETELYYYGYRFYKSTLGRWINRDPLGDAGFPLTYSYSLSLVDFLTWQDVQLLNLNLFNRNNTLSFYDTLGLAWCDIRIINLVHLQPDSSCCSGFRRGSLVEQQSGFRLFGRCFPWRFGRTRTIFQGRGCEPADPGVCCVTV
ncbi:MAG: hypothetical protein EOM20_08930, partial [Spartobacteria bacterium]|nr:hypothetical protein [Spartobacteria bacterium]